MNYLQLVRKTIERSGAKLALPSTVVGQTGITKLFVDYVADTWTELQNERVGIYWRISRDMSFNLVAGTHEYAVDSGLEDINLRSVTLYLAGSESEEAPLIWKPFDFYRTMVDRIERQDGKPQYFSISPDDRWVFWPAPDTAYTVRYDGLLLPQVFDSVDDGGVGSSDLLEPRGLPSQYHDAIVWKAMSNYAMDFEDGSKLSQAQAKFKPYKKRFEERFLPTVELYTRALYDARA